MGDLMSGPEYEAEATKVGLIAQVVEDMNLDGMQAVISRAHAMGAILDPTAYRNGMDNLEDMARLLGPLLRFQRAVKELKAQATKRRAVGSAGQEEE